jgi:uncharacterized RDD family membrane protein YckC
VLLLAHVGYTTGGGWVAQRLRLKDRVDFRLLALMAVSPDIVDRVLYTLFIPDAASGRLIAHTLVFQLVLFAVLVAIRRGFWIYGLASLMHLALDGKTLSTEQLLWPLLGASLDNIYIVSGSAAAAGQSFGERVLDRLQDVSNTYTNSSLAAILLDIGGLGVLTALVVRAKLYERWRLLSLARRGRAASQD